LQAKPVFIDCDSSFCMDPNKLESFCEKECSFKEGHLYYKSKVVRALVIVHVFGNLADMERILHLTKKYNIKVVEDATESLGSMYTEGEYRGMFAGTIGDFGCFSFNGNKIITTGGGGAVTAREPLAVDHIRYLSTQAKNDTHYYIHHEVGYNYRMTNLQAALGVAQLEELPEFIKRKQQNYEAYKDLLEGFAFGKLLPFREGTISNKWFYSFEIDRDKVKVSMREIITALQGKGIETRAIWGLINEQRPYLEEDCYCLEKAPYYANRILNLPCSTSITQEEISYVVQGLKELLEAFSYG
jgi:aminotransferase degT/dnrJ/eryC1/strS family